MKVIFTALIFFLSFNVLSQSWCDNGANWKYSFFSASYAEGYVEVNYTGDTVINGQLSNKLDKHLYIYNYFNSQYEDYGIGEEYTYESNGIVYLWYENAWDTLYNFNASIGDSWRMAKQPQSNACDSNTVLTVTATGTKIINSSVLNYVVVDFTSPSSFSDTIVEKIGFIHSYMLPYDQCNGELDMNEGGAFRCYRDDNFPTYKPHYSGDCDFIVGVNEIDAISKLQIVPNPARTNIALYGPINQYDVKINDLKGKVWSVNQIGNIIWIDELPIGVYVLSVRTPEGLYHKRFIKQ